MQVFISYRDDGYDALFAEALAQRLTRAGVTNFFAPRSIPAGSRWEEVLLQSLDRATHFVVIYSASAQKSKWVQREIDLAVERAERDRSFTIIPVFLSTLKHKKLDVFQKVSFAAEEEMLRAVATRLGVTVRSLDEELVARLQRSQTHTNEGLLLTKLCDRKEQVAHFDSAFSRFMREFPKRPHVFFVRGAEQERPRSLIDRLVATTVQARADAMAQARQAWVPRWSIDWPAYYSAGERFEELCEKLGFALGAKMNGSPAAALSAALSAVAAPIVVVDHTIHSSMWDRAAGQLLERYLALWTEALPESKRAVLLFECVCEDAAATERMHAALASLQSRFEKRRDIPVAALRELACVTREHVERWFDFFTDRFTLERRSGKTNELFARQSCQPMAAVEQKLVEFQGERSAWESGA